MVAWQARSFQAGLFRFQSAPKIRANMIAATMNSATMTPTAIRLGAARRARGTSGQNGFCRSGFIGISALKAAQLPNWSLSQSFRADRFSPTPNSTGSFTGLVSLVLRELFGLHQNAIDRLDHAVGRHRFLARQPCDRAVAPRNHHYVTVFGEGE